MTGTLTDVVKQFKSDWMSVLEPGWTSGFVNWARAIREREAKPSGPPFPAESDVCTSGKKIASPLLLFQCKAAKSAKKRKEKRLQEHTAQQFDP